MANNKKLKPGDNHYRAYVGSVDNYDFISASVFNLLTSFGLKEHHKLLDVGCGSLRSGRLLIPYLNKKKYYGVEPNKWLVEEGFKNELGNDIKRIKEPIFSFDSNMSKYSSPIGFDYALAQSIFSHCNLKLIDTWLKDISYHLLDTGALFATFLIGEVDFDGDDWVYPDCVKFKLETINKLAEKHGFKLKVIKWPHPIQSWGVFYKKHFDTSIMESEIISWHAYARKAVTQRRKKILGKE